MTEVLTTKDSVREAVRVGRADGLTVGFVPTMGALHEGHLSLVRAARELCDRVLLSVFVNPTQFGGGEDFSAYPRDLDTDVEVARSAGVAWVFAPSVEEMYGEGAAVTVDPGPIALRWEGGSRPGHFAGVATVVAKLLAIAEADDAFFGEKDYQQLKVVERLVADLDIPVRVVACPIVRESDGLALSSRNAYLGAEERHAATALYRGLCAARDAAIAGEREARALAHEIAAVVDAERVAQLDYAVVVDPDTLEPLDRVEGAARALVAARVGPARLIDNMELASGVAPCPREPA